MFDPILTTPIEVYLGMECTRIPLYNCVNCLLSNAVIFLRIATVETIARFAILSGCKALAIKLPGTDASKEVSLSELGASV